MTQRSAKDLLYDAQASYPLVDNAIGDFSADELFPTETTQDIPRAPAVNNSLPQTLLRAYAEITGVLERLREGRRILEQATVGRDITAQQLAFASTIIREMEGRLAHIVQAFDPKALDATMNFAPLPTEVGPVSFDPGATTTNAIDRQVMKEKIFLVNRWNTPEA